MKRLLNTNEAAEYVGLHPQSVRGLVLENNFPYVNISKGERPIYRFDIRELDKWIENLPGSQVSTEA